MPYSIVPNKDNLPDLPEVLQKEASIYTDRLKKRLDAEDFAKLCEQKDLNYVLGMSDFIAKTLIQFPKPCLELISKGAIESDSFSLNREEAVKAAIVSGVSDIELKKRLRILRRSSMVPIAWRDLTGRADIEEIFTSLSNLAEAIVLQTVRVVRASLSNVFGNAFDKDGKEMPLLIFGMGKLGGGELNFSSDLDLIFSYPYDGQTVGGSRVISHQEFFAKIVQRVSNLLSDTTVDGFCYRVDLRLRPFGDAGPLVHSFDALSVYYETQGRTWERYALVKAKLLGTKDDWGDYGSELIEMLRPFVYRRYLDFGAIESLRKLKHMIEAEVRRRNLNGNFKLGSGGIREVEFIAQVFELMRGGRIPELSERSLRVTLRKLDKLQLLPSDVCKRLDENYIYLRRLENVIQEFSDQQTQCLPQNPRDEERARLAMNKASFAELKEELKAVMDEVHEEFCKVIRDEPDSDNSADRDSAELWESNLSLEEMAEVLEPLMKDSSKALDYAKAVDELRRLLARQPMGPVGRQTLVHLMPFLIKEIAADDDPPSLFKKIGLLIEKVALRTTYLQLLSENHQACLRLIGLLKDNAFAGSLISAHPILLDELIAPHYLNAPPKPDEYMAMLREKLLRIDPDDLEDQMEELRLFKKIMVLRIAMSDRAESLPLMKISDSLTWLAEALIREISILAWNQTVKRFGAPPGRSAADPGFAIIGYGKLGGIELGYKSDLDMVFIRDIDDSMTEGEHSVPCAMFYQRLVQRLLHLSTTRMSGGVLYDLDMRLRPDGDSGMLVTDTAAFEAYQEKRAWTWEHQALVRARPIAGSHKVMERFEEIRSKVLRMPRDDEKLKQDVFAMRCKMRDHLDRSGKTLFDLKQGRGGMVDIEFIAQYLLLREAPKHSDMVLWSDNVRILDECSRLNILSKEDVTTLKDAYIAIRGYYHRVSLADLPRIVAIEDKPKECADVERIWRKLFAKEEEDLSAGIKIDIKHQILK